MCLFLDLKKKTILTPDFTQSLRGLGELNNITFLDEFTYQCEKTKQKAICSFFFSLFHDLKTGWMQINQDNNCKAFDGHFYPSVQMYIRISQPQHY